ncbi:tetratricopeptide repeat protein [Pontibacter sp. G13]|uniref:tetratricopeptide repeat protein n=1 Tax=Pontibacter sp. G13 TaxID=3074898 RepID=UPI00288A1FAB|nr:tetratricopeptide repeat protein [Pontibacter sp. G13]WNJ16254.1 tetratricopeptide repeat protein [Pontibacter sp. G13]
MLKRVLTFCASVILLAQTGAFAQVDLSNAIANIRGGKTAEAQEELEGYTTQKIKNKDQVYYWLGMIDYLGENYEGAREDFQKALEEKPRSPIGTAGKGRMEMLDGELADANLSLENALKYGKGKDPEVEFAVAEAYLLGGRSEIAEAKKILYQTREKYPENPQSYILLATYYKQTGVPELAIEEFEKAITIVDNSPSLYASLAELYFEQGKETNQGADFKKALDFANQAIELDSEYPPAYRVRAEIRLIQKKFGDARDDMERYVELTGNDVKARIRYASFLYLSGDFDEALGELQEIKEDTVTKVMLRLEGIIQNQKGNQDAALAAMDEYFKDRKEQYIIWEDYKTMGDIYRAKDDLTQADEYYSKMIMKNPAKDVFYEELADSYNKQAKGIKAEAAQLRKDSRAALKKAQEATNEYNTLRETDPEAAKAKFAVREEQLGISEDLKAQMATKMEETKPVYALEAHYREKALEIAESESLTLIYKLALAQYNAGMLKEADETFKRCHELKADYLAPYSYRMRIANSLEGEDEETMDWLVKVPATDIANVWGEMDAASLGAKEKEALLVAYEVLANYNFNPTGEDGNYHCDDAQPFVDKIYEISPDYARIKSLADYCAENR